MAKPQMTQIELDDYLFTTCREGRLENVKVAIIAGANVNATTDPLMETPLHFVALSGNAHLVPMLVNSGANPCALDSHRQTPADLVADAGHSTLAEILRDASAKQQRHVSIIARERKDKGPPQVGG